MPKFIDNLKTQAEQNPVAAIGVAAVAVTALSTLINSMSTRTNAKAWSKEVDRRIMISK